MGWEWKGKPESVNGSVRRQQQGREGRVDMRDMFEGDIMPTGIWMPTMYVHHGQARNLEKLRKIFAESTAVVRRAPRAVVLRSSLAGCASIFRS